MDINYILRRLTFVGEIRGVLPKLQLVLEELQSMSIRKRPTDIRSITWVGPRGDLKINYYDSIGCFRAEIVDLKMLDIDLPNKKDPLILDLGSNQGLSILWFKYNYPGAKIVGYEPFKKSYDIILKNVVDNNFKGVIVNNYGVLDKDVSIPFYHVAGGAGLGDSIVQTASTNMKEDCEFRNIDKDWKNTKKFDLVKIDVEGSEYPIIDNCSFWKKADKIIIEFHENFKAQLGNPNTDYLKKILNAGFKLDKKVGEGGVFVYYFSKVK